MTLYSKMTEEERERRIYRGNYFRPIHGMRNTPVYELWKRMKKRCQNPNDKDFHHYGGRGIEVCEEWQDPVQFIHWAMSNGYKSGLTLDRIDNNRGYFPDNCRFTDMKSQSRNKRTNHVVEYNGESHCLAEWAEITGISSTVLRGRLKRGWTVNNALTIPTSSHNRKGAYRNESKN